MNKLSINKDQHRQNKTKSLIQINRRIEILYHTIIKQ